MKRLLSYAFLSILVLSKPLPAAEWPTKEIWDSCPKLVRGVLPDGTIAYCGCGERTGETFIDGSHLEEVKTTAKFTLSDDQLFVPERRPIFKLMAEFGDVLQKHPYTLSPEELIKVDSIIHDLFSIFEKKPELLWPTDVTEIAKRGNRYRERFEIFLEKNPTLLAIDFWFRYLHSTHYSRNEDVPTAFDRIMAARKLAEAYTQYNGERPLLNFELVQIREVDEDAYAIIKSVNQVNKANGYILRDDDE